MSTKPLCVNLNIKQKTTGTYKIKVKKDNVATSINGWQFYFTVKENMADDDDNAKIKKDITELSDPENGIATISLTSDDTNIDAKTYWYDIKYVTDTEEKGILIEGKLTIETSVTKRV